MGPAARSNSTTTVVSQVSLTGRGRTEAVTGVLDEHSRHRVVVVQRDVDVGRTTHLLCAGIISSSMDLLRDNGYRPDPQLSLAMKALTQSAEFMKVLYPPGRSSEFSAKAVEMTRDLLGDSLTEERVFEFARKQGVYAAREALQQLPSLQEATNMWLRQARKGRFEVKVDTSDLAPRMDELRASARMITLGLVAVGLVIASVIAANAPNTGTFKWVRDVGMVVYLLALVLAAVFIVDLLRRSSARRRDVRRGRSGRRRTAGGQA